MTLEEWINNNHPLRIATTKEEIAGYLRKIERWLQRYEGDEDVDFRLDALHKVMIWIAIVALRAESLKLKTELSHHILLIKSLGPTLGARHDEIATLITLHNQRNIEDYGSHSAASMEDVDSSYEIVMQLRERLIKSLKENHSDLL